MHKPELTDRDYAILDMLAYEALSFEEIAMKLHISRKSVERRIYECVFVHFEVNKLHKLVVKYRNSKDCAY